MHKRMHMHMHMHIRINEQNHMHMHKDIRICTTRAKSRCADLVKVDVQQAADPVHTMHKANQIELLTGRGHEMHLVGAMQRSATRMDANT